MSYKDEVLAHLGDIAVELADINDKLDNGIEITMDTPDLAQEDETWDSLAEEALAQRQEPVESNRHNMNHVLKNGGLFAWNCYSQAGEPTAIAGSAMEDSDPGVTIYTEEGLITGIHVHDPEGYTLFAWGTGELDRLDSD